MPAVAASFFQLQEHARRTTRRLLVLFALALVAVVAAVTLVVALSAAAFAPGEVRVAGGPLAWLEAQAGMLVGTAILTLLLILAASALRIRALRQGGAELARRLGGREIAPDCGDLHERRLRNVVEELAIAACLPVPAIFVLDEEMGINAFAAGLSPSDAAIAVTRGALERLNRDELQGVVAHEFSHVLHGDMRLNMRLCGWLYGILVIGILGRRLLYALRHRGRNAAPLLLAGVGLVAVGAVGVFCARLIQAAVARSREVLADASAVQFTRQSAGLAGALKKAAGLAQEPVRNPHAPEVRHMLFVSAASLGAWLDTHPPLLRRIRMLDPAFRPERLQALQQRWREAPPDGLREDEERGLLGDASLGAIHALPAADARFRPAPGVTASRVAQPHGDDTRRAVGLHRQMPEGLIDAARDVAQAGAVVLALLIDRDRAIRARQLAEIAVREDEDLAEAVERCLPQCEALHPGLRLPLAALCFPALRRLPVERLRALTACARMLVQMDGRISLFDYCLSRMLQNQVEEVLDPSRYRVVGRRRLVECKQALADLFAVLVSHGYDAPEPMRRAYVAGLIAVLPGERFEFKPPRNWVTAMDRALAELDGLDAHGKQLLIEGMVVAICHDGRISVAEAELVRAVCACLHCPLPPVVEQRARPRG
ncbi:MAG: Zn-dependent protease [Lysobacteraceae bacterium]|nr:MAG: Zn-dependent protease [Xanthomonadaceae bacterium]